MQKCFNGIFLIPFFVFSFSTYAQQSSVSPYSRLGLGEFQPQNYANALGMGGANLGWSDSLSINMSNPASYTALKLTTFELGVQFGLIEQRQLNPDVTLSNNVSGIRYFAFGVPVKKWWGSAIGIQPYSFKGYDIATQRTGPEDILITDEFTGKGGLNKVYWGNGFQVADNLSVGVNASYFFGNLEEVNTIIWSNGFYSSQIDENARIKGLRLDYAARYTYSFNDKNLGIGLTFANKTSLNAEVDQYAYVTSSNGTSIDSLASIQGYDGTLVLPNEFGIGLSYSRRYNSYYSIWAINADLHIYEGASFENYDGTNDLNNGFRAEVGGFIRPAFVPNKEDGSQRRPNYFGLIQYRLGGFYENTPFTVGGTQLQDYGITIGFGVPIGPRKSPVGEEKISTINVGAVLGRRGSLENGLIQENYLNLYLGLTLNDRWFQKYKYR